MKKLSTIIVVGIAVAAIIGAAFALYFFTSSENEKSFAVTYYKNDEKLLERTVPAGTSITIFDDMGNGDGLGRFIGWNTRSDMTGKMLLPGSQITVKGNISLYAMTVGAGVFVIILPDEQTGYSITADPAIVIGGGSSILSYSLLPSHVDNELVITVNGNPMKLDAMKRIHLTNITEDQIIAVSGVFDKREHSISLPDDQRGYVLRSSAEKVHHGESYKLEYTLLPGYRETYDFGIRVNGGDAKIPSGGVLMIEAVMDNHTITVTGVEPAEYSVSAGKNTKALVNGAPASKATVEDIVKIIPDEGYVIPDSFNAQIKGELKAEQGGYRIAGNVVFPSVLKITVGDNVKIDGRSSNTVFLCPEDTIRIVPAAGYSLPSNYADKAKNLNGVRYSAERFSFSNDVVLPSIYKVTFNGHNTVHATFYVVGETIIPLPAKNPERVGYYFEKWDVSSSLCVVSDLLVMSIWNSMAHDVYFGPNLLVGVDGKYYLFKEGTSEPPRTIKIKSDEKVVIKNTFDLPLPNGYGPQGSEVSYRNGYYEILGNCSFPGVTYVNYFELDNGEGLVYSAIIGKGYNIISEPTENRDGYFFTGWMCDDKYVSGQIILENRPYIIHATWKPIGG